jgi:hypothetical protein
MFGVMKNTFKILFWISIVMLLVTNLFWVYHVLDTSIGNSYYKTSCEEYKDDLDKFTKATDSLTTKQQAIEFFIEQKIDVDTLQKGQDFHINFKSFGLSFDKNGQRFEY